MARFDKGVGWYSIGTVSLTLGWPEDAVCCRYCKYLHKDSIDRYFCRLTDNMVYNIDAYPNECPADMVVTSDDEYSTFLKEGFKGE